MGDRTDAKRCRTRLAINRARHYSQPYSVIAVETDGRLEYASVDDTHDQPPSSCCICNFIMPENYCVSSSPSVVVFIARQHTDAQH